MAITSLFAPPAGQSAAAVGINAAANATPAGQAISAGLAIAGIVKSILGGNPKDAERLNSNATAYARALAGDVGALDYLKYRSGAYGQAAVNYTGPNSTAGNIIGAWATAAACADAAQKYRQAIAARGGTVSAAGLPFNPATVASPGAAPQLITAGANSLTFLVVAGIGLWLLSKAFGSAR